MRIDRLDLTRYGIFTDYSIGFGKPDAERSDLHIIYGPNEAGKSTALAAILDLLFGIEARSRYGFLHPYATMRIAGEIEVSGMPRTFVRVKRPLNSLLDGKENPIPDGAILGDLGGIDRAAYTTMFSLNDDTLETGGEGILASKGDLGQLLFSASAGLSNLTHKLDDLRAEADAFYKFRGRGGELAELKTRIAALRKDREAVDTLASDYAKLVTDRDRWGGLYDDSIAERGRIQARLEELRRHLGALPRLMALRGIRERLLPLAEIPEAPRSWAEELPQRQRAEIELGTRAKDIEAEIARIGEELEGIVVDDQVLELGSRIGLLGDLRARYVTADIDIPERKLQQRDAEAAIAGILARMECAANTDPGGLLLGASVTGALRELMEKRSGVGTSKEAADEELANARRRLAAAEAKLEGAGDDSSPESSGALAYLGSAVAIIRADDHAARRRISQRLRQEQLGLLNDCMRALRPWTGEAGALRDLVVPESADIAGWKSAIDRAERSIERDAHKIEELRIEQRRLTAEIEAASQVAGVLNDQKAAAVRTGREEAWASHKRTLDAASAEAFEMSLRHDDIVTNGRISNAAEVAQLNEVSKALVVVKADLAAAEESQRAAREDLAAIQSQIAVSIQVLAPSLPRDWLPPKVEAWLSSRDDALGYLAAVEKAEREEREADEDGENIRRKLMHAVSAAGIKAAPDASVETLMAAAQESLDQRVVLQALRAEIAGCERDVDERERKARSAEDAALAWNTSWSDVCGRCWLAGDGTTPTVATVREVLKALDELGPLIEKHASLADRIDKMEADQRRFVEEIDALVTALGMETGSPPLEVASQIASALEQARAADSARNAAAARLDDAEARKSGLAAEKEIHDSRKLEMITHFGVDSLDAVGEKLRNLEKARDLQEQAVAAEEEIRVALGTDTIGAAELILDGVDRSAAENEVAQLEARFDDQDARSRELFSEHSKASDRLEAVGGDAAVARIEERRRTTLLEIEDGAKRYLRLRLGITATDQALRLYRDQHRSSMMARASDAFKLVSRGAYRGLTTQPDGDSEVLVAVRANDGSKRASDLSKGTRFQLYLALRVAGYQEFAQSRRSVPFIADDIMETFDDFRAEEAFKLFAEMGRVGQVIYLTHHKHLCDIARRVSPGVRIHELNPL